MKTLFLVALLTAASAFAGDGYVIVDLDEGSWSADSEVELRWNWDKDEWSYQRGDAELDLNWSTGDFEWREPGEELKYNAFEGDWEFAPEDAEE